MKLQVIITKGIPCSGKSTWARRQCRKSNWKRINKDSLRAMFDDSKYSKKNEEFVLKTRDELLISALLEGNNVIIDDTNLNPIHDDRLRGLVDKFASELAPDNKVEVVVKWFPITVQDAIHRDRLRKESEKVGAEVIKKMYEQYTKQGGPKPEPIKSTPLPIYNTNLLDVIICDLDGTLSLFKDKGHRKSPYDASNCDEDELNIAVARILWKFHHQRYGNTKLFLFSGRSAKYRGPTEEFLREHHITYDQLVMRADDDMRTDEEVKFDFYNKFVKDKYNVIFWLDDRNCVVDMVRHKLGLPCFQVNEGNF